MILTRRVVPALAAIALSAILPAHAHRQPEMVSQVEHVVVAGTGAITQITHRIHAHDAMKIISLWPDATTANLDDPAILARVAQTLLDASDFDKAGVMLGYELDGNYLFVYEEMPGHAAILRASGLSMIDASWTHRVDVTAPDTAPVSHTFSERRGTTPSAATAAPFN